MEAKLVPDPFLKSLIEHISRSIAYSFIQLLFIVCQVEDYRNILKLSCGSLAFTSYKTFLKNKKRSGTSLPASFSGLFFLKKIFSCCVLLPDQISLSGCFTS